MIDGASVTESLDDITGCGDCLFTDYFDRPDNDDVNANTGKNAFTTYEADPNDVAITDGHLRLRDDGDPDNTKPVQREAQAILFGMDVSGYDSLDLKFNWSSLGGSVPTDRFYVQWRPCDDPLNISTNSEEPGFIDYFTTFSGFPRSLINGPFVPDSETVDIPLPQAALDAGCIDLRFVTVVSNPPEGVLLDYVELCGTPTPEKVITWTCDGDCFPVEGDGGEYATYDECTNGCAAPVITYDCGEGQCVPVEGDGGEFATYDACTNGCPAPVLGYTCNLARGEVGGDICIQVENGEYATQQECETACLGQQEPHYSCAFDTNGGHCVEDANGPFTAADCEQNICVEPL
jgi:hypothetical protein